MLLNLLRGCASSNAITSFGSLPRSSSSPFLPAANICGMAINISWKALLRNDLPSNCGTSTFSFLSCASVFSDVDRTLVISAGTFDLLPVKDMLPSRATAFSNVDATPVLSLGAFSFREGCDRIQTHSVCQEILIAPKSHFSQWV